MLTTPEINRIFNLFDGYGATRGFHLAAIPENLAPQLWQFRFIKGYLERKVAFFEDQLKRDADAGTLSADALRKLHDELD